MEEGVLAGLVQIKAVVCVLERRDFHPARDQTRNQLGDQRGFAGTAPASDADNAHGALYSNTPDRKGRAFWNVFNCAIRRELPWAAAGIRSGLCAPVHPPAIAGGVPSPN